MHSLVPWQEPGSKPTPALKRRLERQVLTPARSIGEELALVKVTDPPPPVTVIHPPMGGTWVAAYHDTDPVALGRGGYLHAPEDEIERLTELFEAGVDPDVILIGHQLSGRWHHGDPVPPAYLAGEAARVNRVLAAQAGAVGVGWGLLRAAIKLGTGIGAATVAGAAAIGTAVALDPFVLAGVREQKTGLIGWASLGGWYEEPSA